MATAEEVIAQVQTYMLTLPGIRQALPDLPNRASTDMTSIAYFQTGAETNFPPEVRNSLDDLTIEVITPIGTDLERAHQRIIPLVDTVPNLLFYKLLNDQYWNKTVATIGNITYQYFTMKFNDIEYVGYRFIVHGVSRRTTLTA